MNLTTMLDRHAEERAAHAALVDGTRRLTYYGLHRFVAQLAAALSARGIGPGSRVVVFVPMSVDLYLALLALLRLGATAVFVDPGMGRKQIDAAVALAAPDAFIAIPKAHLLRLVSPALRRVRLKLLAGSGRLQRLAQRTAESRAAEPVADDHPALLTFTSGTTGRPKGVVRSHGFLMAQHAALVEALDTREADVDLPALPIVLLSSLALGATAVLPPIGLRVADVDPARFAGAITRNSVTTSAGSPALFEPLAEWAHDSRVTFPTIRSLFIGGAPVPPSLLARLAPLLPNGDTVVVYGSTEAEPIAHIAGREALETAALTAAGHGLCVGAPVDSIRVSLDDGEVLVAGAHVNTGYLNDDEAVRRFKVKDADGTIWHRTGDVARFDGEGRLWLLGRKEDIIIRNNERIYPFSVELAARARPGVGQAALVEVDGRVVLAVDGQPGDVDALRALHPAIEAVCVVRQIPTDPRHNAKVDREALRALIGRQKMW